jgi:UDP-N-acetylglucosamine 2-epimerase (non-hydrolysing)
MIDNLLFQRVQLEKTDFRKFGFSTYKLAHPRYGVVTLHRPSNVDSVETFSGLATALRKISGHVPLVFPVHPRTRANLEKFAIELGPSVELTGPLPYMEFLNLWKDAAIVLTDRGACRRRRPHSPCRA